VRKLAVEAADNGLLAPELAAGIARIKGVRSHGTRVGNWLSLRQAQALRTMEKFVDWRSVMTYREFGLAALTFSIMAGSHLALAQQPAAQPPAQGVQAQGRGGGGGRGPQGPMSFFVTSVGKGDGANLGGLAGADAQCQTLAAAAGRGNVTWHAYLSTQGPNAVNARDRVGR
jgi:hypothetical protein